MAPPNDNVPSAPILDAHDPEAIDRTVDILRRGGIVVIPTDTVYGIAAALDQPAALARVFASKGRPDDRTLPVLLSNATEIHLVARTPSDRVEGLMGRFWPGPLTIVLQANAGLHDRFVAPDGTVGVRIPDHHLTNEIISRCGGALAVTSANRSGNPSALDAVSAASDVGRGVDAILDGGPVSFGIASTIVRVRGDALEILRAGAIDPTTILEVWNR